MRFTIHLFTTIVLCFVLQYFFPWWTVAIGAFAGGLLFGDNGYTSFLTGFLGVAILWTGMAFFIDISSQSLLTEKINHLLPLNAFVLTGLVGGLVGGLASLTGCLLTARR